MQTRAPIDGGSGVCQDIFGEVIAEILLTRVCVIAHVHCFKGR